MPMRKTCAQGTGMRAATILLVLGFLIGWEAGSDGGRLRPVRIVAAGAGADRMMTPPGTFEAWESAQLAFEVSGRVVAVPVLEGQR